MATVNDFNGDKDIEVLIKIFRREIDKEGILNDVKNRCYFKKDSTLKHEKAKKLEHKTKRKRKSDAMKESGMKPKKNTRKNASKNKSNYQDQTYS